MQISSLAYLDLTHICFHCFYTHHQPSLLSTFCVIPFYFQIIKVCLHLHLVRELYF